MAAGALPRARCPRRRCARCSTASPRVYDRMNSVMTAGMHHRWRRRAADLARRRVPARGRSTSPPAPATWRSSWPARGAARGRARLLRANARARPRQGTTDSARAPADGLEFVQGNALELPYADGSFDAATVGFGARNFADLDRGLARAGARRRGPAAAWSILEITTPQKPPLSWFFRLWFDRVVPALGRLAGDPDAYTYLPVDVRRFPGPRELAERMVAAGLSDVRWVLTAGGIIAIHGGHRGAASGRHPMNTAQAQLGAVLAAGGPELAARCSSAPRRGSDEVDRRPRRRARPARDGDAGGRRQAAAPDARLPVRERRRRRAAGRGGGGGGAAPHGDARARRRARQRAAAARAPDGLRRGRPAAATATGDLLFSRAFAELASTGSAGRRARAVGGVERAGARRADAARRRLERRRDAGALPRALPAQDGQPVRGRVPAGRPVRRPARDGRGARGVRRGHRPRLPDPRRRARRVRSGRAHRQAPRHRPARRHGHAAADPGARARDPRAGRARPRAASRREQAEAICDRIAATGALDAAREQALAHVARGEGRAGPARPAAAAARGPASWWPTAWWSATPRRRSRSLRGGWRRPSSAPTKRSISSLMFARISRL